MRKFLYVLTMLLSACATSFSTLDEALPALKGKDIEAAIAYLGVPDQKYVVDGREVYVWSTEENYASISSPAAVSRLSCKIKISTKDKIVEKTEYDGNNGTCFLYSERLKPLISGGPQ